MVRASFEEPLHCEISLHPKTNIVVIKKLEIQDREFFQVVSDKKESARLDFVTKALKISAIALQDIAVVEKTDYNQARIPETLRRVR